ncbi:tumor necrosis factor receptor superfamily member 14-like [Onychostoma macrolepis]|uniref:TNFR-Cys domain-containing protein n=1 Tax=Onychostoma macrolepis TaxID=369639 RepID=A0A7J6DFI6_9TELE|nr:tumor necrosis factor receptor superfamily member 14-like [Onychostoma macrolepis]KAF4118037.1 hypothetical protein G5714_000088 [Onychostoma macrolepis]
MSLAALLLLIMNIVFCMATCNNAEYEINGKCCPVCDPGKRVKNHCDENTKTICGSCPAMTFTNIPNGYIECLQCFVCDPSNGLRVKQACTSISNTVCEPLPGYYCIDLLSNCKKAMKHSSCSPGQYINQTGTEFSDTVCNGCPVGSYSEGTFCKFHSNCESLGKITVKEGTDKTDAECNNGAPSYLLPLILSVSAVCVLVFVIFIILKTNNQSSRLIQVTTQGLNLYT